MRLLSHILLPIGAATLAGSAAVVYAGPMQERPFDVDELPPARDRLPTIPHDLSEYARIGMGNEDEPLRAIVTAPAIEIWPSDVPSVTGKAVEHAGRVGHREAFVLSLLDGESTLASVLDGVDLPEAEVIAIVSALCARGIVALDCSQRPQARRQSAA